MLHGLFELFNFAGMEQVETLLHYYQLTDREIPSDLLNTKGATSHFNVLKRDNCLSAFPFQRRDYYKISLVYGKAILYTANGEVAIDQYAIIFSNPNVKFGWKALSNEKNGYICLFNEQYLSTELRKEFKKLYELFKNSIYPLIFLDKEQYDTLIYYFNLMYNEYNGNFAYKKELVENILRLIIYTAIKIQSALSPEDVGVQKRDRLVNNFIELLDSQFPVESPQNGILYKTPAHFANQLHVHVNHLNHSLKAVLGKSTTQLINERIGVEAIALIQNSDWNISEIGSSLGFEYPQHFNVFFKRQTGSSPKSYRNQLFENV